MIIFVLGMENSYDIKFLRLKALVHLKIKIEISDIDLLIHKTGVKGFYTEHNNVGYQNLLVFLAKKRVDTIRPKSFSEFEGEDNLFYFLYGGRGIQGGMIISVDKASNRGIHMAFEVRGSMINSKEGGVEVKNIILNGFSSIGQVTTIISKGINSIPPFFVKNRSMEEVSIRITLSKPVNSGFNPPEFLLLEEDEVEFLVRYTFRSWRKEL